MEDRCAATDRWMRDDRCAATDRWTMDDRFAGVMDEIRTRWTMDDRFAGMMDERASSVPRPSAAIIHRPSIFSTLVLHPSSVVSVPHARCAQVAKAAKIKCRLLHTFSCLPADFRPPTSYLLPPTLRPPTSLPHCVTST